MSVLCCHSQCVLLWFYLLTLLQTQLTVLKVVYTHSTLHGHSSTDIEGGQYVLKLIF